MKYELVISPKNSREPNFGIPDSELLAIMAQAADAGHDKVSADDIYATLKTSRVGITGTPKNVKISISRRLGRLGFPLIPSVGPKLYGTTAPLARGGGAISKSA